MVIKMKPHHLYDSPCFFICESFVPFEIIFMKTILAMDISEH